MAGFVNTSYKVTVDAMVEGFKKKLNNPYYAFTNERPTKVTYYNQNMEQTTLDEGSKLAYQPLGDQSPIRFNRILDAYLFGMGKIAIDLDNGEFGLEADSIEGDAIVIPNTFQPTPDDYFCINYASKVILFRVTSVNIDTLENGSNFYKLTYKLDQYDYSDNKLDAQVVDEFIMSMNNVGTQYKAIVRSSDYLFVEKLDMVLIRLKEYYKTLFFKSRVQTFVCPDSTRGVYFYDSFLIEFLIRNKVLEGSDSYVYVSHQVKPSNTFYLDYDKTFFRNVELKSKNKINTKLAYAMLIQDPNSLLVTRLEPYYQIDYHINNAIAIPLQTVNLDLVDRILSNDLYAEDDNKVIYNIIINYFNNTSLKPSILDIVDTIEYKHNMDLFYTIPVLIFILEDVIKKLLAK